jgi:hypothetical protein
MTLMNLFAPDLFSSKHDLDVPLLRASECHIIISHQANYRVKL